MDKNLFIGEGFEGAGVNLAHINVLLGPRNGPVGQAFATALATPSLGHAPFVVIVQPGIPAKPLTLYVNKAQIESDTHAKATCGACSPSAVCVCHMGSWLRHGRRVQWHQTHWPGWHAVPDPVG